MYHKLQGCESYKSYNEMGLWLDLTLSFITKNDRRNMKIEGDAKKEGKKWTHGGGRKVKNMEINMERKEYGKEEGKKEM